MGVIMGFLLLNNPGHDVNDNWTFPPNRPSELVPILIGVPSTETQICKPISVVIKASQQMTSLSLSK